MRENTYEQSTNLSMQGEYSSINNTSLNITINLEIILKWECRSRDIREFQLLSFCRELIIMLSLLVLSMPLRLLMVISISTIKVTIIWEKY